MRPVITQLKPNSFDIQAKLEYITTMIQIINEYHKNARGVLNRGFTNTIQAEDGTEYTFTIKRKPKGKN